MSGTAFNENDCCGNGCANCVLDETVTQKQSVELSGKANLIENYIEFVLKNKEFHSNLNDVIELHFSSCLQGPERENFILRIPSGHHVMMRAPIIVTENGKPKQLLRPYSPYWVDGTNLEFKILINLKPNGLMSKYLSTLQEGSKVEFRGPIGGLYAHKQASPNPKNMYIFSQGVATAPILPIIEEIVEDEDDMTIIMHFACFPNLEHIYFRKRLHELSSYWNYSLRIYLPRQQCGYRECLENGTCIEGCARLAQSLFYKEKVFTCRLTEMELRNYCKPKDIQETVFVIAGTRQFQTQITDILKSLDVGANDKNICLL